MTSENKKQKTILIIGGSFAGIRAAEQLVKHFKVIVVDRKEFFEFTPSIHYAIANPFIFDQISLTLEFIFKHIGVEFHQGEVTDLAHNEATIVNQNKKVLKFEFDYCIIAIGSVQSDITKAPSQIVSIMQRQQQILDLNKQLFSAKKILVIGSGPVGVEIATEIAYNFPKIQIQIWTSSEQVLNQYPKKAQDHVTKRLTTLKIQFIPNKQVKALPEFQNEPESKEFDIIFDCRGNQFKSTMMNSHFSQCLDQQGRIIVDKYFRVTDQTKKNILKNFFAVGDCCSSPYNEAKMSYNADLSANTAANNIILQEQNKNLQTVLAFPANFVISLGGVGIMIMNGTVIYFPFIDKVKQFIHKMKISQLKGSKFAKGFFYFNNKNMILMAFIKSKLAGCCKKRIKKD